MQPFGAQPPPAKATTNNKKEPNLPAAVAVHPATANNAHVLSRGDMAPTIGSSVSIKYGNLAILSLPSPPLPMAVEVPSMSLNLLDGKTSTSNTTVGREITRVVEHAANTTSGVETFMMQLLILYPLTL
jgi:hypothetical protein